MKKYLCEKCQAFHTEGEPNFEEHTEFRYRENSPSFFGQALEGESEERPVARKVDPVLPEIARIQALAKRSGTTFSEVVMALSYIEAKKTSDAWLEMKEHMDKIRLRFAPDLR